MKERWSSRRQCRCKMQEQEQDACASGPPLGRFRKNVAMSFQAGPMRTHPHELYRSLSSPLVLRGARRELCQTLRRRRGTAEPLQERCLDVRRERGSALQCPELVKKENGLRHGMGRKWIGRVPWKGRPSLQTEVGMFHFHVSESEGNSSTCPEILLQLPNATSLFWVLYKKRRIALLVLPPPTPLLQLRPLPSSSFASCRCSASASNALKHCAVNVLPAASAG